MLEREGLSIAWCLKKAPLFPLRCRNLNFITEHRALTSFFQDKELKDIDNPRILNLREKTLMYTFHMNYLKGKANCAVDTLEYPLMHGKPDLAEEEMCALSRRSHSVRPGGRLRIFHELQQGSGRGLKGQRLPTVV